jgi:hypothetical protein
MYDPIIKLRDPLTLAEHLAWAATHWKEDNRQPRDLDELLRESSITLRALVHPLWRILAVIEAIALISMLFWR